MRIVLDTNVLISAVLNPSGAPARVLGSVLNQSVTLLVENRIFFEYEDVLSRDKFGFPKIHVKALLEFFESEGEYISAAATEAAFADDDDRPFCEVAHSGKADYLVSGNRAHFPKNKMIGTPRQFTGIMTREG